ncbi:YafY family protein [Pedobacter sp. P351]|uniref:helix-turn-helix transcriptional regulator n=1 Tax=Pedobacter superstes TaxID=3133441 RepID=UPI0030AC0590
MNRIDRLSAILFQLQSQRVVKAQEIANRFEISLRTVYRDVKALEEAGIPVIGEAGVGYSLVEGYRLPPVMFTREEATAFLTAEKLVERLTDTAITSDYKSAMYKIKSVLRTTEKDYLENMDSHIEVLKSRRQLQNPSDLKLLPNILSAISERRAINITYFTHYRQEKSDRCIEPIGVFFLEGYWHLIAFCLMRNSIRDFRMDRISKLTVTDENFLHQHPSLKEYLKKEKTTKDLLEIIIRVDKEVHKYLDEQKYYNGFVSETHEGKYVIMNFFTPHIEWFARWFMMFGDEAKIIKPAELKEKVKNIVSGVSANLKDS